MPDYTAGVRLFVERVHVGEPEVELRSLAGRLQRWGTIVLCRQQPYWKTSTLLELRVDLSLRGQDWKASLHEVLRALGSGWTTNETDFEASATCDARASGVLSIPHAVWANVEVFPSTAKGSVPPT